MVDDSNPPRIFVTPDGGARYLAQIRSHQIVVDQTIHGGGEDSGPEPIELLGAALGTCVAYYIGQFLKARGLSTDGLGVAVEQYGASNPHRVGAFDVHVVLPAQFPSRYLEMIERVARSCPVHNTLARAADVRVSVELSPSDNTHAVQGNP
jgi:uncharacterized OsmC-like protein